MTYKELQDYLIKKRKKSINQYNNIISAFLTDAPTSMARRKIWVLHLTSDPLGQLIFSESYKEFTKFMNEEVEFKEIKPWMK